MAFAVIILNCYGDHFFVFLVEAFQFSKFHGNEVKNEGQAQL